MNLSKRMVLLLVMISGGLLATSANARDAHISYNYVDLGWTYSEVDDVIPGVDADGNGPGIRFSGAIHPNIHLFGGYTYQDIDVDISGAPDIDGHTANLGIGYNYSFNKITSIFARADYVYARAEADEISVEEDEDGFGLSAGLRYMLITDGIRQSVLDGIEFQGSIDYVDLDETGDNTSLGAGVLFHITTNVGLGIAGSWGDDETSYVAGLRLTLD
ncbi:MAG: outer membrane beta-barrel protein [Nitrosomonadaceae bacterium]